MTVALAEARIPNPLPPAPHHRQGLGRRLWGLLVGPVVVVAGGAVTVTRAVVAPKAARPETLSAVAGQAILEVLWRVHGRTEWRRP